MIALSQVSATNETGHLKQLDERLARLEADTAAVRSKVYEGKYRDMWQSSAWRLLAGFIHVGVFISHL